jgi:pSer/pThr/pTyr-binding forkhead associated (FHA) protein
MSNELKPDQVPKPIPRTAFVIVDGVKVIPIRKSVVNLGRKSENDVILSDPHVSRYHAQILFEEGYFILVDLNSTVGTSVNGQRITQSILSPGDVISLAGVPIIFGQGTGNLQNAQADPQAAVDAAKKDQDEIGEDTGELKIDEADEYLEFFDDDKGTQKLE